MIEKANLEIPVEAPPARCFEVITDFVQYPDWASDIKEVKILRQDSDGMGSLVEYRAAAIGRSISYTLEYFYGKDPLRCAWQLSSGELLRLLTGKYEFAPSPGDPNITLVTYKLAVELAVPLPGFVRRRLETRVIHAAIDDFRCRAEEGSG